MQPYSGIIPGATLTGGPTAGEDERDRLIRIREKELEELVVVLFAKLEVP